jgi:hypothetical protein
MWRRAFLAAGFMMLAGADASAETYGDKIKAVDPDQKTLTLPVDGKDRTFKVDEKVDVQSQMRAGKRLRLTPVRDGLKGVKVGTEVTVTTEKRAGEEVVTKIVVLVTESK